MPTGCAKTRSVATQAAERKLEQRRHGVESPPHSCHTPRTMLITGVILLATLLASFTDWLFMDVLVHRFYQAAPALWRPTGGTARILVSQLIGTLASAAMVVLGIAAPGRPFLLAGAAWAAGPLPIGLQNLQWMRLHPAIAASHAAGWLVRLLIAALLAAWLLPG